LLNFDALTISTPSDQSMSARPRRMTSPIRKPVAASRPSIVWKVAARIGVGTTRGTDSINASTSLEE
jgi:hypothetical protein